jgi:hypothetical protein
VDSEKFRDCGLCSGEREVEPGEGKMQGEKKKNGLVNALDY